MKRNRDKILTKTSKKIIIRQDRIEEVLDHNEVKIFNEFISKISDYDKSEKGR